MRIQNAVVFDVAKAVRYEDDIEKLAVLSSTFGLGVAAAFQEASAPATKPDVRNLLVLGSSLPAQATAASNLATTEAAFVGATSDDYHLIPTSPALDKGETIAEVPTDRDGTLRPQGAAYDIGAYEQCDGAACGTAGAGGSGGSGASAGTGGSAGSGASASGGAGVGATTGTGGTSAGTGGKAASSSGDDGGCGCRTGQRAGGLSWLLGLIVAAGLLSRRRKSG